MTDTTLPPGGEAGDRIEPVDIQQEMQRSYIDYAMSVIVGRALPEVRDGLKPVHRRVLYAMYDSGFRPDRSHAKSARSVAETMGQYHPHGDECSDDNVLRGDDAAVFWCLANHEADEEATLVAVMQRVKGPDFPTSGLIVGSQGISDAYKTGRGSIRMHGVVEVEEARGRTSLVITELPYQV